MTVVIAGLLIFSPFASQGQTQASVQWNGNNANYPFNWDYVQQSQVSASNAENLQVSWLFPVPAAPKPYVGLGDEAIIITPIVVNGIVYSATNYHLVLAMDARNGKIVWSKELPVLKFKNLDVTSNITGHYHAIWYTSTVRGAPLIWVVANNYTVFAFNALTGDVSLQFSLFDRSQKIPGNFGLYGTITPQITIDEKRGILIGGSAVSEGTSAGRGFYLGFDITKTPPKLLWRTFMIPPQDGSNPNWSIGSVQNMSYAYIFDGTKAVDLKALPSGQLHDMLYADWGNFAFNGTHSFAGAATGWGGSSALDPTTGMFYVGTGQPSPDWNATDRPGPNLWTDAILAIDGTSGKIVWGFQSAPHDLWDVDCSWNVILANATIAAQTQKVVLKACKIGYLFALDAATGKMLWSFSAPLKFRPQDSRVLDPTSKSDMNKPWQYYGESKPVVANAFQYESNIAYDPTLNLAFIGTFNFPSVQKTLPVRGPGIAYGAAGLDFASFSASGTVNTTIWGVDVSTGQARWHFDIPKVAFRGGISVSNGLVFVPTADASIYILNAQNGQLVTTKFIGGQMITQPAIAADSNGNIKIIAPVGAASIGAFAFGIGITTPGFMFALDIPPSAVTTSVSTSVVTSISTATLAGPSTGVAPETLYGAIAVAVIFIIATGVLAVRRRVSVP